MGQGPVRVIRILTKDQTSATVGKIGKKFSEMNKNIKKTTKSSQAMGSSMAQLKTVMIGMSAAMGGRQIVKAVDSFQLIKDRIRSLWGEGINAQKVFEDISKVADQTNAPIETLADGFARMSISTKDMGFSTEETLKLVMSLQQTLRLSGATVQEANSVFLQFSQAMGLGRIQGQELRAVMLSNAEGAKLLANIFNTTKGGLREMGEKGLLYATKMAKGFMDALPELTKRAEKLKVTFGQAFVKVLNAFNTEMDKLNFALKGSSKAERGQKF